jgi:Flp/Fap pilin component
MKNLIARFVKDESGATAIEYGLIAAGLRSRSSRPSTVSVAT